MNNCKICNAIFEKKAHNQELCNSIECKNQLINNLQSKYRKQKRDIENKTINCKICNKEFPKFGRNLTCSLSCSDKNIENIKLKYYIENVMPELKYKPKLTEEQKEKNKRECNKNYNNTPERKEYLKKYRQVSENKIKENASGKRYSKRNPNVGKNSHLKRNYNISLDDYLVMALNQEFKCAICKNPETSVDKKKNKVRDLAVDHCHVTGKVRGLLCWKCNTSIGRLKDSIEILQNAIDYLKKSRENNI